MSRCRQLPPWHSTLAVVAHPDDESFGLGAVLTRLAEQSRVSLLCLTHGEASTLHGVDGNLATVRASELRIAATTLGLDEVVLLEYRDGHLADEPADILARAVLDTAERVGAEGIVVFDPSGVTGHPDHRAATAAALRAAVELGLPVLAWTIPENVAATLNAQFGTSFVGHADAVIDIELPVDRRSQRAAVTCHSSQAVPSSALWRRLELLGDVEHLRWVHDATNPTS